MCQPFTNIQIFEVQNKSRSSQMMVWGGGAARRCVLEVRRCSALLGATFWGRGAVRRYSARCSGGAAAALLGATGRYVLGARRYSALLFGGAALPGATRRYVLGGAALLGAARRCVLGAPSYSALCSGGAALHGATRRYVLGVRRCSALCLLEITRLQPAWKLRGTLQPGKGHHAGQKFKRFCHFLVILLEGYWRTCNF